MPTYLYRPYYSNKITTHEQFMRDQLSDEEAAQLIAQLPADLEHYFEEGEAQISIANGILHVKTDLSEKECHLRVAKCLTSLNLRAEKQNQTSSQL